MWRPNTDEWALRGRLGAVAATIIDGETASHCAKNGVPVRFPGMAVRCVTPNAIADLIRAEIDDLIDKRKWQKAEAKSRDNRATLASPSRNWAKVEMLFR
jgi:hypothetical protein